MPTIQETIARAVSLKGNTILKNKRALCNVLEDLAPKLQEELVFIKRIYNDDVGNRVFEASTAPADRKNECICEIDRYLYKDNGRADDWRSRFFTYFFGVFGEPIRTVEDIGSIIKTYKPSGNVAEDGNTSNYALPAVRIDWAKTQETIREQMVEIRKKEKCRVNFEISLLDSIPRDVEGFICLIRNKAIKGASLDADTIGNTLDAKRISLAEFNQLGFIPCETTLKSEERSLFIYLVTIYKTGGRSILSKVESGYISRPLEITVSWHISKGILGGMKLCVTFEGNCAFNRLPAMVLCTSTKYYEPINSYNDREACILLKCQPEEVSYPGTIRYREYKIVLDSETIQKIRHIRRCRYYLFIVNENKTERYIIKWNGID